MTRDIEDDPVDDGLLVREAFWIFRDTTVHMRRYLFLPINRNI
jgi:hypothetical protein